MTEKTSIKKECARVTGLYYKQQRDFKDQRELYNQLVEELAKQKKQNPANFFAAWDENELIDLDFTTQEVLADNEAFDIPDDVQENTFKTHQKSLTVPDGELFYSNSKNQFP